MKPGQKGITLALDQYKEMRDLVKSGSIDAIIKKQGGDLGAEREAETISTSTAELGVTSEPVTNDQLEEFFDLSNKKSFLATKTRFTVRKCKLEGDVSLDIREYHEKDGDMKPGQKGITLALDQYKEMRDLVKSGSIDAIIMKQGGDVE
jgi:hypothetical protein